MNAPVRIARPRQEFAAWMLSGGDRATPIDHLLPTLPEIEAQFAQPGYYGATIFLLESDALTEGKLLRVYRIRRGGWNGHYDRDSGKKLYRHSADLLFALPVHAFDPVTPWRYDPGADRIGAGPAVLTAVRS